MAAVFGAYVVAFGKLREIISDQWVTSELKYPPTLNQTLRFFIDAMLTRSRGAYVLLVNDACWESELVLRSMYEAFARCMTFATSQDSDELLGEFWTDQLAADDRRTAQQSVRASKVFPEGDLGRSVMAALNDPKAFQIEAVYNKKERRTLNQKWSFSELVEQLSKGAGDRVPFSDADSLLHMYGMQSSVAHVSAKFYDLLWDRATRTDGLEAVEEGHVSRQLSDAVWLTAAALFYSLRALGVETARARAALEVAETFNESTEPYKQAFDASQREFYEREGFA